MTPADEIRHLRKIAEKLELLQKQLRAVRVSHALTGTALARAEHQIERLLAPPPCKILTHCQAQLDGDCDHKLCPQLRDGEPTKSGRFCPLPSKGLTALREHGT